MEVEAGNMDIFDMDELLTNLPQKRGLSRYYSGKSRSFMCLADVHTLEDLKKQDHREPKKRRNYRDDKETMSVPPAQCRHLSSNTQPPLPCMV
ncbi:hypothetical protein RND81_09G172500 [Saponaria officinalis]|uniref:Uncharacterized protein n=1 Tax=Saponaria officinalis TaxID=3572 RepID=A0AAW1IN28_SAPOF